MSAGLATRAQGVLRAGLVLAVIVAAYAIRVVAASRHELQLGDRYAAQDDPVAAIVHYRRAARWYAPGSPYHVRALSALAQLAANAEREGDADAALSAYRAIRAGILSARSFYIPEPERLAAADARIADLMAATTPPPIDAGKTREQLRLQHLALLTERRDPALGWTLLLLLGFVMWMAGGHLFAARAVDGDRFVAAEVRRWGTVIVVGIGMFLLGLAMA